MASRAATRLELALLLIGLAGAAAAWAYLVAGNTTAKTRAAAFARLAYAQAKLWVCCRIETPGYPRVGGWLFVAGGPRESWAHYAALADARMNADGALLLHPGTGVTLRLAREGAVPGQAAHAAYWLVPCLRADPLVEVLRDNLESLLVPEALAHHVRRVTDALELAAALARPAPGC